VSHLCERPGCSETGDAEYGMVPEDLLFWIAPMSGTPHEGQNVLCRRHADAMSVPRGWTLDDRREPIPRLFMPRSLQRTMPSAVDNSSVPRRVRRTPKGSDGQVEQLVIDGTGEIDRPDLPAEVDGEVEEESAAESPPEGQPSADDAPAPPRNPSFDPDNDLDGLLEVSSPLLARAFRGTGRGRD
jgi:hypothetical protein